MPPYALGCLRALPVRGEKEAARAEEDGVAQAAGLMREPELREQRRLGVMFAQYALGYPRALARARAPKMSLRYDVRGYGKQ